MAKLVTRAEAIELALMRIDSIEPQVMGLQPGATSEQIQRAYNKLRREKKGDDAALSAIEAAHSSLMMSQLTMRMQARHYATPLCLQAPLVSARGSAEAS